MHIYFSGVSGVAIGPLAMIALDLGHTVSGSDLQQSEMTTYLQDRGARISIGEQSNFIKTEHQVQPIDWYIYSSALTSDHPELVFAKEQGIKISKRADFINQLLEDRKLKMIAITGTHGKTTTTGMVIWLMKELGLPISYSIGTTISFGPPAQYQGGSEYFIYECDEFDRNFLEFHPEASIITTVDYDHPDTYKTPEDYVAAFNQFAQQSKLPITWHSVAEKLEVTNNMLQLPDDRNLGLVPLAGEHNRRNAWLAATAVERLGLFNNEAWEDTLKRFTNFPGTNRRFEKLVDNLYTDYAHHPVEIAATIDMALELNPNVVVVYQPHQNIRQHLLLEEHGYAHCFDKAKLVYWLPTYLSREDGREVITPETLIAETSNPSLIQAAEMNDQLWQQIEEHRQAGDLVICMSAGDLDAWLRGQVQ
jgi:UDP-N-acetylmuramate--alanine ligase